MDKPICQKCGQDISNQFGVTLSFCTGCGATLTNLGHKPNSTGRGHQSNRRLLPVLLGGLAIVTLLGSVILSFILYLFFLPKETGSDSKNPQPTSSVKPRVSVSAAEITEVSYHLSEHFGPLVGSDTSYTKTSSMVYSKDGTVQQIKDQIIYDTGQRKGSEGIRQKGVIPKEKFEKFAQILVENDFANLENPPAGRSETRQHKLIIKYSGNTKELVTEGSPQIENIMNGLLALPIQFEN